MSSHAGASRRNGEAAPIRHRTCAFWLAGISDSAERSHDVPARVNLTIAGHAHGGQVYVPGIGRPIVPSLYGERFAAGHIEEGGRHPFVSQGLGTSLLPVRFLVPPEVSVPTLASASETNTLH